MSKRTRHDGDCWWFAVKICTCGYLHDIYPPENGEDLTKKQQDQVEQHEFNLAYLNSLRMENYNPHLATNPPEWPPEWPVKRSPEEQKKIDDLMDDAFGIRDIQ